MPIWMPPTPPEDGKDDYYTDYTLALTYNLDIMDESQLPPIYISRRNEEDGHIQKKKRLDHAAIAAAWKVNLPEVSDLRGLRERPVPLPPLSARKISDSDGKGRRQSILPSNKKLKLKIPNILSTKGSALDEVEWTISDDWALLQAVAALQELNLGLLPEYSGHTPNWGVVADVVNLQSSLYKSPPQCRDRYDHVVALREEGRLPDDYSRRLKKMKSLSHIKVNRTAKTHVQVTQDMGLTETELNSTKFDVIHSTAMKRTAVVKPSHSGVLGAGSNHAAVLEQRGVSVDSPVRPKQLAVQRADRIAMEKSTGSTSTSKREGQPQQPLNSAQPAYKVQERPVALTVSGTQLTTLLARNPMQQSVAQIGAVPHSVACLPAGTVSIAATAVQVQGAPPFIKRMAGPLTAITGQVVSVKQPGVTAALHHQPSQPLQQSARLAAQEQKVSRAQSELAVSNVTLAQSQKLVGQPISQPAIVSSTSMVTGPGQLATLVASQAPRTLHQQQQMTALPRVSSATTVRQITTPLAILQRQPFKTSPQMIRSVHVQQLQQALRAPHVSLALTSTGQQRFTTTVSQIPSTQITPQQHQSQEQLQAKLLQAQLRQTPSPGPQQLTIQGKSIQHPSSVPTPPQAIPAVSQEGFPQVTRTLNQPHPHPQLCQSQQQQVLVRIQQPHGHQYLSQFPRVQQPIQSTLQMPLTSVTSPAPNIPQESELMLPSQADRVTPESRPPSNQPQVQSPGQAKPMAVGQQGQGQGQTRQPYSMRPRNPSRSS